MTSCSASSAVHRRACRPCPWMLSFHNTALCVTNPCWLCCRQYDKLLDEFSSPKEGTKALHFSSKYPKPFMVQFHTVFQKYSAAYWRMPEYNGMRFFYAISVGFLFGAIFWRLG